MPLMLHFALKEGLVSFFPAAVRLHAGDGGDRRVAARVQAELPQQQQTVRRRRPGLAVLGVIERGWEIRAAVPLSVIALKRQQPGTPAPGSYLAPFGGHVLRRGINQVLQHLPADGGIGVEQPVQDVHPHKLASGWTGRKLIAGPQSPSSSVSRRKSRDR
jgi:hypothetical protein